MHRLQTSDGDGADIDARTRGDFVGYVERMGGRDLIGVRRGDFGECIALIEQSRFQPDASRHHLGGQGRVAGLEVERGSGSGGNIALQRYVAEVKERAAGQRDGDGHRDSGGVFREQRRKVGVVEIVAVDLDDHGAVVETFALQHAEQPGLVRAGAQNEGEGADGRFGSQGGERRGRGGELVERLVAGWLEGHRIGLWIGRAQRRRQDQGGRGEGARHAQASKQPESYPPPTQRPVLPAYLPCSYLWPGRQGRSLAAHRGGRKHLIGSRFRE